MSPETFPYSDSDPIAVEQLQGRLMAALAHDGSQLTLDLDQLPLLDDAALRGLILLLRGVREAGGTLMLRTTRKEHRDVLRLTALDRVFELAPC